MSGGREGLPAEMATAADRIEYLELLSGNQLATNEIVDRLDDSRSTVTRALRELREAALIEKTDGKYTATSVGTMAAATYREYESTSRAIFERKQVLEPLDGNPDIPTTLPREATVYLAAEQGAFAVLEAITDTIRSADRIEAYLPTVSNPHLLRVWHELVDREAAEIDVTVPSDVFDGLRGKYPELLGEMSSGPFTARTVSGPDYGLLLTEHERQERYVLTVLIYADSGTVHGALQTDRADAVRWGERTLGGLRSEATDVTGALADLVPQSDGGVATATSREATSGISDVTEDNEPLPLSEHLREEGFERLSDNLFTADSPVSAATAWQTGLTLADVADGRAVDRTRSTDDEQERLDLTVRDRLRAGDDCVLIGPPGSGKSTVCKQVACEWHDDGYGPVLYRERGSGTTFESATRLEAYLRQQPGQPLVVVEDVVRADASAIFETLTALRGTEVSFLFDARQSEWEEAGGVGGLTPSEAFSPADFETVAMPELDADECEGFIDQFEADFDQLIGDSGSELLSDIRARRGQLEGAQPGAGLLLRNQLAQRAVQLAGEDVSDTDLGERVREACREFAEAESGAVLDTAIQTAVLKASGLPVARDLLYGLVSEWSVSEIEDALNVLEGRILFDTSPGKAAEYRTRHEVWATEFLTRLSEVLDEPEATHRFQRCVNALLELSEDEECRSRIRVELEHATANLNQIDHAAGTWADETVERIFRVGIRHPALAPLFGRTSESEISLPEPCSSKTVVRQAFWRGRMAEKRMEAEATAEEYEHLQKLVDTHESLSAETVASLKVRSLVRQSDIESMQNRYERAEELAKQAIKLAEDIEDHSLLARSHFALALSQGRQGDIREGREYLELTLEHAREAEEQTFVCRALTMLGTANWEEGNLDEARRLNEEGLSLAEETGVWRMEANACATLSKVAWERANFERSSQYAQRCYEVTKEQQSSRFESPALRTFGRIACSRGDLDEATQYAEDALEITRQHNSSIPSIDHLRLLARIERYRGNLDEATRYVAQARSIAEEHDNVLRRAQVLYRLATIALSGGDKETARQHLEDAEQLRDELRRPKILAKLDLVAARVAHADGNNQKAVDILEHISATFREMQRPRHMAECHRLRAMIATERGCLDEAVDHATEGLRIARESGVVHASGRLAETAGEIKAERGEHATARDRFEQAVERFDELDDSKRALENAERVLAQCRALENREEVKQWSRRCRKLRETR